MSSTFKSLLWRWLPGSFFDKSNKENDDLIGGAADALDTCKDIAESLEYTVADGSGTTLDNFGNDYAVERKTGESDTDYRVRLKEALLGRGVTRPRIETAVNRILGDDDECTVIKWDEDRAAGILPIDGIAIDLPDYDVEGFYLDDEGEDEEEDGAYLDIGAYLGSFLEHSEIWPIQMIIDTINLLKPATTTFQLWSGDFIYSLATREDS